MASSIQATRLRKGNLIKLGQEKEGIACLDKVVEIDPLRPEPHMALAKLYALNRQMEPAVKHAEIAAGKEPGKSFEILAKADTDTLEAVAAKTEWHTIRHAAEDAVAAKRTTREEVLRVLGPSR